MWFSKINILKLHLRQSIQMAFTSKNLKKAMQNIFKGKWYLTLKVLQKYENETLCFTFNVMTFTHCV